MRCKFNCITVPLIGHNMVFISITIALFCLTHLKVPYRGLYWDQFYMHCLYPHCLTCLIFCVTCIFGYSCIWILHYFHSVLNQHLGVNQQFGSIMFSTFLPYSFVNQNVGKKLKKLWKSIFFLANELHSICSRAEICNNVFLKIWVTWPSWSWT